MRMITLGFVTCQAEILKKLARHKDEECSISVRLRELRFNKLLRGKRRGYSSSRRRTYRTTGLRCLSRGAAVGVAVRGVVNGRLNNHMWRRICH